MLILALGHFPPLHQGTSNPTCTRPFAAVAPRHFPSYSGAAIFCHCPKALPILLVCGHSLPLRQGTSHVARARPLTPSRRVLGHSTGRLPAICLSRCGHSLPSRKGTSHVAQVPPFPPSPQVLGHLMEPLLAICLLRCGHSLPSLKGIPILRIENCASRIGHSMPSCHGYSTDHAEAIDAVVLVVLESHPLSAPICC